MHILVRAQNSASGDHSWPGQTSSVPPGVYSNSVSLLNADLKSTLLWFPSALHISGVELQGQILWFQPRHFLNEISTRWSVLCLLDMERKEKLGESVTAEPELKNCSSLILLFRDRIEKWFLAISSHLLCPALVHHMERLLATPGSLEPALDPSSVEMHNFSIQTAWLTSCE